MIKPMVMKLYMVVTSLTHRDSAKCCISKVVGTKEKERDKCTTQRNGSIVLLQKGVVGIFQQQNLI